MLKSVVSAVQRLFISGLLMLVVYFPSYARQGENTQSALSNAIVTYCIDPDWMPYESIENNQHVGISSDYFKAIAEISGLVFEFIPTNSWRQTLDFARDGQCDLVSMLNQTPDRETYLLFTQPLLNSLNVLVSSYEQPFLQGYANIGSRLLGVVEGYRQAEYIAKYYPYIRMKKVSTESEGLRLLAGGEIDVFVGSMLSINFYIQQKGLGNLKIAGWAADPDILRIGVAKGDTVLLHKLDEAIAKLSEEQHISIYNKWNNLKVVEKADYRMMWFIIASFLLVILLIMLRNRYIERASLMLKDKNIQLQKLQDELLETNKTLEFLSMHDSLTNLYNRHFIIRRCEEEIHRVQRTKNTACLMVLDIDHFKQINDTYGHSFGDEILRTLSDIMVENIREIDMAARWGGEEFLILCPYISMSQANELAGRLCEAFAKQYFGNLGTVTFSVGLAEVKAGESFVEWFDRADKALYEAKSMGRDRINKAE